MSRKGKKRKSSKYIPDLQKFLKSEIKHNRPKIAKSPKTKSPSLDTAKVKFKVPSPKQPESPKTASSEGNLLQQYKYTQNYSNLPTNREIVWQRFIEGLDDLPAEIRIQFVNQIDELRAMYGDEAVAYYLDKHSLLDETEKFSTIDYTVIIAITYLYQLARGLELAFDQGINEAHEDLKEQAKWMIDQHVRSKNQGRYYANLTDEAIQDHNLTMLLDEYVDSLWDENE